MEWTQTGGARATGRRKGMPQWHHSSRSAIQGCMQRGLCHMGKGRLDQPRPCVVCRPGNMGRRLAPQNGSQPHRRPARVLGTYGPPLPDENLPE
jgi:hypothetical protein